MQSAATQNTVHEATIKKIAWVNVIFLTVIHALGIAGIVYLCLNFSWPTLILGIVWFAACGLSITGGYHRLFSHKAYKASALLRMFYLLFGAASTQNSAIKWSADHRQHHKFSDEEADPYSIKRGFWWAHIGWIFHPTPETEDHVVSDLAADPLVRFQEKYYIPLAVAFGWLLPGLIALYWNDFIGGVLVAGFARAVFQYQATFCVNSVAHWIGQQPYCKESSARDSYITAIVTLGEGYHNFHHRFPTDYRNGTKFYHFDPTKWWVWTLSKIGITSDLRRVPNQVLEKVREEMKNNGKTQQLV